jgi:hypothetical protein
MFPMHPLWVWGASAGGCSIRYWSFQLLVSLTSIEKTWMDTRLWN